MSFAFNFSGDDFEDNSDAVGEATEVVNDLSLDAGADTAEPVQPIALDDLVSMSGVRAMRLCCEVT